MLYATLICLDSITHARMYRLHQAPTGDTATTRTRSARCGVSARAVRPRLARTETTYLTLDRTRGAPARPRGPRAPRRVPRWGNGIGGIPFAPLALSLPLRWLCMGKAGAVCF